MPKLVIFKGDAVENETRLVGRPVRLGRDTRNDIVLDDKSVSRFHAEVRPEGDKYFIVDLKSRNGVWVSGQQVKGKSALALGSPVTLGAFELTLEDDVPTGEFDEESPLLAAAPRTMVNVPTDQSGGGSRSATRAPMKAPASASASKRQAVLWGGAVAAFVIICGVTFAVVRYRTSRPVAEVATTAIVPTPEVPPTVVPPEPPIEDPNKVAIDRDLADGQAALGKGDYAGARERVTRILGLDPDNAQALDLKRQVDAAVPRPPRTTTTTTSVPATVEVETPGIPRKPNELWATYTARVEAIKQNLEAGKNYLAKQSFALALARFRTFSGDAPKYGGVDQLIIDTLARQKAAVDTAVNNGDQNEKAGKFKEARQWYQNALQADASSVVAREKDQALLNRVTPEANRLSIRATSAAKTGEADLARGLFQQVLDLMLPGDEIRERAVKELEKLKR